MAKDTPVCLGMFIRLRHKSTDTLLKALARPHSHPNTSGQLMVVTTKNYSDSSLWQVVAGSRSGDSFISGQNVDRSEEIRLREFQTGHRLHSHGDRLGYTHELAHQEVTSWTGSSDLNDDWLVEPRTGSIWYLNQPVRIVHKATGKNLHSHARSHPEFTAGFQEVTAFSGRDDNDLWIAERDGGSAEDTSSNSDVDIAIRDESGAVGYGLSLARRASSQEICLNAGRYAAALVRFFREKSHDEFCFAIYGHWGRGKTYLMELVGELLEKPEEKNELPTRVVFFRAWKYPTTPEVWVHLYETLAKAAGTAGLFLAFVRNMRVGIAKAGLWPLFFALCTLAFAVMPKFAAGKILWSVFAPLLGIGGIIWVVLMATGIRGTSRRLWRDYLSATRHDEKLGLQATIGKDLKALLEGWLPSRPPFNRLFIGGFGALTLLMVWSTFHWFGFGSEYFAPSSVVEISLVCLFPIVGITAILLISFMRRAPGKVLLVVDDLDRCALLHLLNIIESIKLLVEEPAIRSRLQVAMLVEEQVLRAAILEKYEALWNPTETQNGSSQVSVPVRPDDIVRENLEKLFSAHLRLEPLQKDEVRDLLYVFGTDASFQADNLREQGRRRDAGFRPVLDSPENPLEVPQGAENSDASSIAPAAAQRPDRQNVPLTEDEKNALWDALREFGFRDKDRDWGPRAVRLLAFRFQLARLILEYLQVTVSPNRLANLIVALTLDRSSRISDPDPTVLLVAKQVT